MPHSLNNGITLNKKYFECELSIPDEIVSQFTFNISVESEKFAIEFSKSEVFGQNTKFLIDDGNGTLREEKIGIDGTYQGRVLGKQGYLAHAVLTSKGLMANILCPDSKTITILPMNGKMHRINIETKTQTALQTTETPPASNSAAADISEINETLATLEIAASDSAIATTFGAARALSASGQISTATLPPSRVMDVREYELAVEIGSRSFLASSAYNGDLNLAMNVAQGIVGNMNARYLHSAGMRFRIGNVIVRTNAATDPLRDQITEHSVASLRAFGDYWQSNLSEVGDTHDVAIYHIRDNPSGFAHVSGLGDKNRRYLTCSGNGPTSWADGTLAHELGHMLSLNHHSRSLEEFYESKPRNNAGSNSAGGEDVFISVMHGSGNHNVGRLATGEANRVYNFRRSRPNSGDLVTNPQDARPFGHADYFTSDGSPVMLDVIANDYDANNDVLDVHLLDTISQKGATLSISQGTGPGGRNEILYTPGPETDGQDFFHYTVCDSTGLTDWGAAYVLNPILPGPPLSLTQTVFRYDCGTDVSERALNFNRLTPAGNRLLTITGSTPSARDRGTSNRLLRDFHQSSSLSRYNQRLTNGTWNVTLRMGDASFGHDNMGVRAEGQLISDNVNSPPGQFPYVSQAGGSSTLMNFDVTVTDGVLNLEFFDNGGSDQNWVLNQIELRKEGSGAGGTDVSFISPSPANNATLAIGSNITIQVDAPSDTATVSLFRDNTLVRVEGAPPYEWNAEGQNDLPLSNLAAGSYTFRADATSNSGAVTSETLTITVEGAVGGSSDVSFVSPSPANNATLAVGSDITIQVDAPSNTATVRLFRNGTLVRTEGGAPYEWNAAGQNDPLLRNLTAGNYTFRADVTSNSGTVTSETLAITVTGNGGQTGGNSTPNLVRMTLNSVSNTNWTSVNLGQTYNSAVIIATPIYPNNTVSPVVTRLRNVSGSSFEIQLARADSSTGTVTRDVSIIALEEGVYTQATNGITMEAVKYTSTATANKTSWVSEPRTYQNSYTNPVVVGQVMSANDADWSTFWSQGASRTAPPSNSSLSMGKHVGEDPDTPRANETIGYIVIEAGSGSLNGTAYSAGLGADSIRGTGNAGNGGFSYALSGLSSASAAALSVSGMDGADGCWAVLFGSNPITASTLTIAVEEDVSADAERKHTTEQVGYIVFE